MMNTQKIDSERARDAFEELRSRLDQQTELRRATVDVEKAAAQAAAIGRMVQEPEVRQMFELMPHQVFTMEHVNVLEKAALAAWHAVVEHRDAAVKSSSARVPAELVAQATEVKQRMLRVASYHLPDEDAIIADIQAGQGYADLASDLVRLGKLYEANEATLARDRTHYRRDDATAAVDLAHRIYAHLGEKAESAERTWAEYVQRAWTFLLDTYAEVSAAGRWLYRHDGGDERFPSLVSPWRQTAMRSTRNNPEAKPAAEPEAEPEATIEPGAEISAAAKTPTP